MIKRLILFNLHDGEINLQENEMRMEKELILLRKQNERPTNIIKLKPRVIKKSKVKINFKPKVIKTKAEQAPEIKVVELKAVD